MKNNKHYKSRGKAGEEKIYSSPAKLLAKAYAYFDWCDANPCTRPDLMKSGGMQGEVIDIPIGRPYTMAGLCVFCGISEATFDAYEVDEPYSEVVNHIRNVIAQEQLEGALLGHYNATIVARLQGLGDKEEEIGKDPIRIAITMEDTKKELQQLQKKLSTP